MKKALAFLLLICVLLSVSGCSYTVKNPLPYPDYTFRDTPDTTQLRQTAVQAMRDLLSIEWCSPDGIAYHKKGSKKHFQYPKNMTFGGVMYTGASAGLFHFLEFYDYETGQLLYPGTADELKLDIGSACADSLLWSWATVSNSTSGGFHPNFMVQKNGFIPVGTYEYNASIPSFSLLSTETIISNNGPEIMAESYAQALPADALVSSTDIHAMMVIENPTVVYLADGKIDTASSYIMIQDQRGGIGAGYYDVEHDGYTVHHSGRISEKFTFDMLMEKNYIPMTTAEFVGTKAYDAPTVTVEGGECTSFESLSELSVVSNYPIAVININTKDAKGRITNIDKIFLSGAAETGAPRNYELSDSYPLKQLDPGTCKGIQIEVVSSTGKRFIPIDLTIG